MVVVDQGLETSVESWADQETFAVRCGADTALAALTIVGRQAWHVGDVITFSVHRRVLGHLDVVRTCGQLPHETSSSLVLFAALSELLAWGYGLTQFRLDENGILLHTRTEFSILAAVGETRAAVRERFIAAHGNCPRDMFAWGAQRTHRLIRVVEPRAARELLHRPPEALAVRAVNG